MGLDTVMRTVITISSSFDYFLLKAKWSDEVLASREDSGVCMLHGQRIPIQSNKPVQLQRRVSIHISFLILFVCELKATLSRSGSCSLFQKGYRGSLRPIRVVRWDLSIIQLSHMGRYSPNSLQGSWWSRGLKGETLLSSRIAMEL